MSKLSVIVPVYNVEKYLRQCLDSIVNQTYKDLEIILVNDGSKDKSGDICREYAEKDNRIIFIDKENGGVVSAYTEGFQYVTSDYVTFVDSDDWLELNMYEIMMSKMLDEKDIDLVVCAYDRVYGNDNKIKTYLGYNKDCYIEKNSFYYTLNKPFVSPSKWNKIYITDKLNSIIKSLDLTVSFAEDSMVILPYVSNCNKIYYIDSVLYHYRMTDGSITNKLKRGMVDDIKNVYQFLKSFDYKKDNIQLLNESFLELYRRYFYCVISSNLSILEKISEIKKVLSTKEYQYFLHNSEWKCYTKKQENIKRLLLNEKSAIKYYRKLILRKSVRDIAEKTGVLKIYQKIK